MNRAVKNPHNSHLSTNQLHGMLKEFQLKLGLLSDYSMSVNKHHIFFSIGHYLSKKNWPQNELRPKALELFIHTSAEYESSESLRMALIKLLVNYYPMHILQRYDTNFPLLYMISLLHQDYANLSDEKLQNFSQVLLSWPA